MRPAVSNQTTKPQPSRQREHPHPRDPVISVPAEHLGHVRASTLLTVRTAGGAAACDVGLAAGVVRDALA